MTFNRIISDLEKKIYRPVYLLFGDEPFFIDGISGYIEDHVLSEEQKEFNQTILYGNDTNVHSIIDNAKRYPMASNYQVLIIREAQNVDNIEELASYAKNPTPTTILVLNHKYRRIDKRKKLALAVQENGVLFESKKLYEDKVPGWITQYLREKGYSITPKAAMMLTESVGADLSKVTNEINKILINIPERSEINDALVEAYTGISKDYNVFELQKALLRKDSYNALKITRHFGANPKSNPLPVILTVLYNAFAKTMIYHKMRNKSRNAVAAELGIMPFFVRDYSMAAKNYSYDKLFQIIGIIREYDLRLKGVNSAPAPEGELLKEMIYKILVPTEILQKKT